jgi:hypothetical protein
MYKRKKFRWKIEAFDPNGNPASFRVESYWDPKGPDAGMWNALSACAYESWKASKKAGQPVVYQPISGHFEGES